MYCLSDLENFSVFFKLLSCLKGINLCDQKLVRKKQVQNLSVRT